MRISNSRKVAQELQFASAMEIDGELQRNVNMFLRLKDARLRAAYDDFNCHNQSLSSVFMLNLFILLFSATFFGLVVADHSDSYDLTTEINWSITIVYLLLINIISWVAYIIQRITMYRNHGNLPLASRKVLQYAQMTAYFALNIFVCYRHISREVNGPCKEDHNVPNNWNCNVLGHAQAITLETSIIIMMVPIMYSISVRGAYFEFAIGLWTMTLATLIFSVCYGDERNSILFVAYYMIGSVTILIESRRQNYYLFFTHQKLQSFLVERDRAADAANAQEMRHMIANVAHDLKTVSCSVIFLLSTVCVTLGLVFVVSRSHPS